MESNPGSNEEIIENIDIGGPTMVRAAAKNCGSVAVVVDPEDYSFILELMDKHKGEIPFEYRRQLALKAFSHTALYDSWITRFFSSIQQNRCNDGPPDPFISVLKTDKMLRVGENPHQKAWLYRTSEASGDSILNAVVLSGKEMSFNNYMDAQAAVSAVRSFAKPAAVIVKHQTPCGA